MFPVIYQNLPVGTFAVGGSTSCEVTSVSVVVSNTFCESAVLSTPSSTVVVSVEYPVTREYCVIETILGHDPVDVVNE